MKKLIVLLVLIVAATANAGSLQDRLASLVGVESDPVEMLAEGPLPTVRRRSD